MLASLTLVFENDILTRHTAAVQGNEKVDLEQNVHLFLIWIIFHLNVFPAPVAWSASNREPRFLHRTGGWERRWPCIPGSLWRGWASDSVILSLTIFQRNCWLWTSGWGWYHRCWWQEDCMPHVEGVGTTPQSSSGRWWGRSSWLHQRSGWRCAVRLPPCGREGHSRQQTAAQ